ncbi:MAG: CcmD family protein [Acidobacteria bacterium]|nr:CcmD family protein [Acidobacteriota bacterium]
MKNFGFLFSAYVLIWAGICAYLFRISRLQGRIRERLERLRAELDRTRQP